MLLGSDGRQVADLAGQAGGTAMQPPVEDHAHAEAGADRHEHEVANTSPCAARELTDGREVDVVLEHDGAGDQVAKAAEHFRAFPSR